MKDQYLNIDEIFRKKFEDYEPNPPEGLWGKIKTRLPDNLGGAGSIQMVFFSAIVLISLGVVFLFTGSSYQTDQLQDNTTQQIAGEQITDNSQINQTSIPEQNNPEAVSGIKENEAAQQCVIEKPITANEAPVGSGPANGDEHSNPISHAPKTEIAEKAETEKTEIKEENPLYNERYLEHRISGLQQISLPELSSIRNMALITRNLDTKPVRISYAKFDEKPLVKNNPLANFKLGAFLYPEFTFYPDDSVSSSRNYNFGIDLRYYKSSFFIKTGVDFSIAKDEGKYTIDYKKWEFLGTYQDVYDVTFDSTEQGIVPTYHTKTVEVFDSVQHVTIRKEKNTYTYLQVPLMVGYEIRGSRLNYSFMAGPNLSLMMSENIPEPEIEDNITIVNINKEVPERINTSWQMLVGIGISYKLSDNMEFALEPTLRYYLNSAYKGDIITTKHPYSVGVRAGLLFKLK